MPRVSSCAPASPRPASGWVDRREDFTERGGLTAIFGARRQRAACAFNGSLYSPIYDPVDQILYLFRAAPCTQDPAAAALPHLDLYRRHDAAAWRASPRRSTSIRGLDQSTALSTRLWFLATLLLTLPTLREAAGSD